MPRLGPVIETQMGWPTSKLAQTASRRRFMARRFSKVVPNLAAKSLQLVSAAV